MITVIFRVGVLVLKEIELDGNSMPGDYDDSECDRLVQVVENEETFATGIYLRGWRR